MPVTDARVIAALDDQPSIRRVLHRLLQSRGYSVESFAGHGDDATRRRVEASDAAAHLWKPVEEHASLNPIRRAIELYGNLEPDGIE